MSAQEHQDLRLAVREVIAARYPTAMAVASIRRRVEQDQMLDFKITDEGVMSALAYLAELNPAQAEKSLASLGATDFWKATAAGVRAWERGER